MRKAFAWAGSPAFRFVLALGIVNLFADTTYEGGGAINGPFLSSLGASAAAVSIIAGLGEFLGYSLRSLFGLAADRSGRYWTLTFAGYAINLFSVPAMALAPSWPVAAALIIAERVGRAMRKPSVEAMLSYTTHELGRGWVFALNNALDETGATVGPLLMTLMLARGHGYRGAFSVLLVSSALAIAALTAARVAFPLPAQLGRSEAQGTTRGFTRAYFVYSGAGVLFAAGMTSFELISVHLCRVVDPKWVPAYVAAATVAGIAASLVLGRAYDKKGIGAVVVGAVLSALFAPLVFEGGWALALLGMLLWGVGYATQDALLKAVIAGVLPQGRRGLAFGLFYAAYGAGWLLGSIAAGLLYESSRPALAVFCVTAQLLSVPLFVLGARVSRSSA